jgi:methionine synthase II (cobalamin-independent)
MLLPTSLVGSYPQPDWLIDRVRLSRQVPRVRADLWLVAPDRLEGAQDDATILVIRDQERAGLDIITDGANLDTWRGMSYQTVLTPPDEKTGDIIYPYAKAVG